MNLNLIVVHASYFLYCSIWKQSKTWILDYILLDILKTDKYCGVPVAKEFIIAYKQEKDSGYLNKWTAKEHSDHSTESIEYK